MEFTLENLIKDFKVSDENMEVKITLFNSQIFNFFQHVPFWRKTRTRKSNTNDLILSFLQLRTYFLDILATAKEMNDKFAIKEFEMEINSIFKNLKENVNESNKKEVVTNWILFLGTESETEHKMNVTQKMGLAMFIFGEVMDHDMEQIQILMEL